MTTQGIIVIDIMGLGLIVLLVNLTRTRKLSPGYGVLWLLSVSALMVTVSFPALLSLVTRAVGALFPVSALSLLGFVFIFLVLIYFSARLSAISARQARIVQLLALREALEREEGGEDSQPESGGC